MDAVHQLRAQTTVLRQDQVCAACRKPLLRKSGGAGTGTAGGFDQDRWHCSATCQHALVHTTRVFVQGFLLGWVLCSFSGKSTPNVSRAEDVACGRAQKERDGMYTAQHEKTHRTIKQESDEISSAALTLLQDKSLYLTEKGFSDPQTFQPDLDDIATPVHFGCDLFDQESPDNQSGSSTETEDFVVTPDDSADVGSNPTQVSENQGYLGSETESKPPTDGKSFAFNAFSSHEPTTKGATQRKSVRQSPRTSAPKRGLVKTTKSSRSADGDASSTCRKAAVTQSSRPQRRSTQPVNRPKAKRKVALGVKLDADPESFNPPPDANDKVQTQVCAYCGEAFSRKLQLKQHIRSHHTTKGSSEEETQQSVTCEFCAQIFMNRYSLKAHIRRKHSGEEPVECDICGKVQPGSFALSAHKKACHDFNSLCHICGAEFSGRTSFNKHIAGHVGLKRYFCDVCGTGFVHNSSLNNHRAVHLTTKAFQCHVCPQMFKVRYLLNEHLLKSHQGGPSLEHRVRGLRKMGVAVDRDAIARHAGRQCVTCGGGLGPGGKCPEHPERSQEAFRCPWCGGATSNIVLFYQHVKRHGASSPTRQRRRGLRGDVPVGLHSSPSGPGASTASLVRCEVCSKSFTNLEYLSAHMHQHREARFACHVCAKRFTYKCNLKTHLSTHLDSWQFECGACGKKFRDKHAFKKHQLKHAEPQFKCQVCGKALTRRPYLMRHYQKMHPEYQPTSGQNL